MNNGKREYAENGDEEDATNNRGRARRIYCYLANGRGVAKKIKRAMNRRFRKSMKQELLKKHDEDLMTADELYIEDILNKFK